MTFYPLLSDAPMSEFALIILSTVLVNNFVLVQFLGLCPFMGTSSKVDTALGMSLATAFVLTLSSVLSYLTYQYLLVPLDIPYMRTLAFIVVIATTVQLTEMYMRKHSPLLYRVLGIFLPLITSNCAVLGVALLTVRKELDSVFQAAVYGLGASIGITVVQVLFAAMRQRLAVADIPQPFKGAPIAMMSAGIMSLAFMGFTGLIRL